MTLKIMSASNREDALYTLTTNGKTYTVIETAAGAIALGGAVDFADNCIALLEGVEFVDEDTFAEAREAVMNADGATEATIPMGVIASETIRNYLAAIIRTVAGDDTAASIAHGERLATLRRARGMSQDGLARTAGVKLSTLQKLESGKNALIGRAHV